jgi:hypothetical protein
MGEKIKHNKYANNTYKPEYQIEKKTLQKVSIQNGHLILRVRKTGNISVFFSENMAYQREKQRIMQKNSILSKRNYPVLC